MKSIVAAVAAVLFGGLVCAGPAEAATVSGAYNGTLTQSSNPAFPYLSVGDSYRIQFSYDTTVPDTDPAPERGFYQGAVAGNVLFSNGYSLTFTGGDIFVGNDVEPGDSDYLNFGYEAAVTSNFPTGLFSLNGITWTLVDLTRQALSSDQLPPAYLSAALFAAEGRFDIGFTGPGGPATGAGLTGTLTSTPIPAALPLFAAALGGLGVVGWRRRNSAINLPR
jgi:hypothetical protein